MYGNAKKSSDIGRHPSHNREGEGQGGGSDKDGNGDDKGGKSSNNDRAHLGHDPNNEYDLGSVTAWVALADFYTWPHVTTFDSFEQLFSLLSTGKHALSLYFITLLL